MEADAMDKSRNVIMDAKVTTLLNFIKGNQKNQLVIPIYQRLYSWEKEQCKQLLG